ncbi:sulfonate transport system substrate-binding protein [Paraburkholderia bryophila]|uniref:Putative aliphatic sulfonates-binding protein n=2 Tax=Paraburkholderia bryophila TaxID=420952 RepID=A0A7Y9WKU7_9BURK|nr:ABC transporter substrate-binding protein [Paraburkholderia bryophila]NYH21638.1 sulfonate transport system substrate-binding protein [Paraburkholderia bryophila]
MTQRFDTPVSPRRRRLVAALPAVTWLGASGGLMSAAASGATPATNQSTADPTAQHLDLSKVRLRVATYKGGDATLLKTAGLADTPYTIDWAEFQSGNAMVEAMNGGALDIASGSEIPPIFARLQNAQVRVIAVYKDDVNNQVVLVPKGSTIRSIADLKGKRVGYLRATTTHYYLLRMLEEAGLSFNDIQATSLAPRDGFAAFNAGSLDAWAIYGYNVPLAISRSGARVLKNANGYLSGNYLYYGHPATLTEPLRRAASADLLVRLQRACTWFGQHQDAYAKVLSAELRVPEEAIVSLYRNQSQLRRIAGTTAADIASEQQVADTFARAGVIDRHVDVAPLWTDTFNAALAHGA